jgi:molybdopterin-guanine dinucleotide biosynthesis protein A
LTFRFFLGFTSDNIQPLLAGKEYLSLVMGLTLVFALAFQMPLALMFLGRLGLITVKTLKKYRPYAIVGFFVIGAILTPPDAVSQCFLALTLILLYELSILLLPKPKNDLDLDEATEGGLKADRATALNLSDSKDADPQGLAAEPLTAIELSDQAELKSPRESADSMAPVLAAHDPEPESPPDSELHPVDPAEPLEPASIAPSGGQKKPKRYRPMKEFPDYAAALLCGGLSRRMGADKAFLRDQNGRLLLAATAEKLAAWFGQTRLIADRSEKFKGYPELSFPVDADLYPKTGPLGAILTALKAVPGRVFFVLAADQPLVDLGIIQKLRDLIVSTKADVVLPRRPGGAIEPLYAFYGPGCQKAFEKSLNKGHLAIRASFPSLKVAFLDLSPADIPPGLFRNLNTPEEAKALGYALDRALPKDPSPPKKGELPPQS